MYLCLEGRSLPEIQKMLRKNGYGQGKIKVEGHQQPFHASKVGMWGTGDKVSGSPMAVTKKGRPCGPR